MHARQKLLRWWWLPASLLGAVLLSVAACQFGDPPITAPDKVETPEPPRWSGPPLFQDVTAGSGIDHTYHNGQEANHYAILESLGGGVALIDYDGDGLLDIFVTGGGTFTGPDKKQIKGLPCKLYKNLGNWKFRDVTKEVGLDRVLFYSHGAAVADYDRDGWPDLLVTGYGRVALYHNVADPKAPGGRRFEEVTKEAGLLEGGHIWATSAAFADFDGDGWPDLYICQYVNWSWEYDPPCPGYHAGAKRDVCPPKQFQSVPHRLYRNDGKGHFLDVTREAGIRVPPYKDNDYGKGLGVIVVDVNNDRRPDIYVANDTTNNFLYINQSTPGHLRFTEVGMEWGVAVDDHTVADGSMGADAADWNGTGRPSLWCTNYENENHALYRNDGPVDGHPGQVIFQFATQEAGIARFGQPYVGFGTGFLDLDSHGWEDLFISNGHVIRYPKSTGVAQPPLLLRNTDGPHGRRLFDNISERGGAYFQALHCGRGIAIGDLDNDGLPDLVISHLNEPVVVLRNAAPAGNHWLGVELVGQDRRDVVGAKLTLDVAGRTLTRFAKGGGSYLSANDSRRLFGLGSADQVGTLTVHWPSGDPQTQQWTKLPIDRYWRLVQGEAEPQPPMGKGRPAK
jgi:hypothetical protein